MKKISHSHSLGAKSTVRGFTLVELMVAMTGAIFISVVVFTLARDATKFFQSELRVSEATISTVTGFERLRQDIARAAFLASPNLARDINMCPRPPSGGAVPAPTGPFAGLDGFTQMGLAQIQADTKTDVADNPQIDLNGLTPDTITMWGNYTSNDQFPVRTYNLANNTFWLEPDSPAMLRHGLSSTTPSDPILDAIFPAGRILRVVDGTNREQYAMIQSTQWVGADPQIVIDPAITLTQKANNAECGIRGVGADLAVNPVNIVRYELDSLAAYPGYAGLDQGTAPAYDADRLELVRNELNPRDLTAPVLDTELVAEYAVDLRFGLTVLSSVATGALTYLPEGDAAIPNYAGETTGPDAGGTGFLGPQMIRGIHARLIVRQRLADRETGIPGGSPDDIFRVQLVNNADPNIPDEFARTRTLRSHIATRNTRNSIWN